MDGWRRRFRSDAIYMLRVFLLSSTYYWYYSALNPDPLNLPTLDPEDEFLLDEPIAPTPHPNGHANGAGSGATTPSVSTPQVAWLRRTEYISRASTQRAAEAYVYISRNTLSRYLTSLPTYRKIVADAPIDVSVPAQIRDIEATFPRTLDEIDLSTLRHPNKPNVTAVESFEIFPDAEIWANEYDLFRFSERPGDRPLDVRPSFFCLCKLVRDLTLLVNRPTIYGWIVPSCDP